MVTLTWLPVGLQRVTHRKAAEELPKGHQLLLICGQIFRQMEVTKGYSGRNGTFLNRRHSGKAVVEEMFSAAISRNDVFRRRMGS